MFVLKLSRFHHSDQEDMDQCTETLRADVFVVITFSNSQRSLASSPGQGVSGILPKKRTKIKLRRLSFKVTLPNNVMAINYQLTSKQTQAHFSFIRLNKKMIKGTCMEMVSTILRRKKQKQNIDPSTPF